MKINPLGIICLVSLYISQAYTHDVDLRDQLSPSQKDYMKTKIRLLNEYLKSLGNDKHFTEKDIYDLLNTRMNKHIQDKNIDIHIIHKKNKTQPVKNNTTHHPKLNDEHVTTKNIDIHIIHNRKNKTQPVKNNTTHHPNYTNNDLLMLNEYLKSLGKKNKTQPVNYEKIDSLSKVFQLKKAFMPVWTLNPLYYIIEKLIQIFAYLVQDDDFYELEPPVHYYDYSV
uniref:SJCHGC02008 protein n=1 Tax=Schistosoma japonicum TaxID=6182 RepID=Q5DBS7_SCHJA|nr:SJCHGC02008 protein [Schistosoma japonicum]